MRPFSCTGPDEAIRLLSTDHAFSERKTGFRSPSSLEQKKQFWEAPPVTLPPKVTET